MHAQNSQRLAAIVELVAVAMWGATGIFLKFLVAGGLTSQQIAVLKLAVGLAFSAALVLVRREDVRMPPRDLAWCAAAGLLGVLGFSLLYCQAVIEVGMGTATVLMYLMPSLVMAYECIRGRERFALARGMVLALSLVACGLVSGLLTDGFVASPAGIAMGVGSAVLYAVYNNVLAGPLAKYDASITLFWLYAFSAPAGCLLLLATGSLVPAVTVLLSSADMLAVGIAAGFVCNGLSYYMYGWALGHMPASRAAILATFEPVSAVIFGVLLFAEPMTLPKVVGVICELVALLLVNRA